MLITEADVLPGTSTLTEQPDLPVAGILYLSCLVAQNLLTGTRSYWLLVECKSSFETCLFLFEKSFEWPLSSCCLVRSISVVNLSSVNLSVTASLFKCACCASR